MTRIAVTTSSFDLDALPEGYAGLEVVANPYGRRLTEQEAAGLLAGGVVGLIAGVEPLTAQVLEQASELRAIARVGTGTDNVDLEAAERRGIAVSNTPDAPTDAVAELTIALMLAVLRHVPQGDAAIRAGGWPRTSGRLLGARTVGLVGAGRIGRRVAELLAPFGCRILVADPLVAEVPTPAELVGPDTLVAAADVLSLHVPLVEDTFHLVDADLIDRLPDGAVVVNTARGGLVDEQALHDALAGGRLAGAAIDVFDEEPYTGPLRGLENVVLSPHSGAAAVETRRRMEREAAQNLLADLTRLSVL